jgi:DNA mismatch repair protein PMS2
MENLDALKANGFEVTVNEDAPPGRGERVSLKAMPVSKETTFDFHGQSLKQPQGSSDPRSGAASPPALGQLTS